jgi:heat shock protein HtpX
MPLNYGRTALLLLVMTLLFLTVGYVLGGQGGLIIAFVVALGMNLFSLYKSDRLVLRMHQAQEVDARTGGELYAMVADLAQRAELPMPRVAIMRNPQPNAFATGRNPENSTVAVSTGLLELLSKEEIAGVVAHELAHIKNRDTLTMTAAASFGGAISMIAQYLQFGVLFGRGSGSRFGWLGFIFAAVVAPLSAMLVQMAISRSREYQADRLGALIVGRPDWLASALVRIHDAARRIRNNPAEAHRSTAHMFIVNPLIDRGGDNLFTTHPSIENRIAALEELARELAAQGRLPHDSRRAIDRPASRNPGSQGPFSRGPSSRGPSSRGPWG